MMHVSLTQPRIIIFIFWGEEMGEGVSHLERNWEARGGWSHGKEKRVMKEETLGDEKIEIEVRFCPMCQFIVHSDAELLLKDRPSPIKPAAP